MSAVSEIYKILDNAPSLEARVADRVYIGNYPTSDGDINQRPLTPYVIVEEVTTVPGNLVKGRPQIERAIIQIDVISPRYRDIKEVRDIIRDLLSLKGQEIESGSRWEEEVRMYRETMEWSFWFPR